MPKNATVEGFVHRLALSNFLHSIYGNKLVFTNQTRLLQNLEGVSKPDKFSFPLLAVCMTFCTVFLYLCPSCWVTGGHVVVVMTSSFHGSYGNVLELAAPVAALERVASPWGIS